MKTASAALKVGLTTLLIMVLSAVADVYKRQRLLSPPSQSLQPKRRQLRTRTLTSIAV